MTGTSTDSRPRTTWYERLFVLGGLMLAALWSAASFASGAGAELIGPVWMAAIAWTVLASLAGALRRGFRHRDWSAFRSYELPDGRDERIDWATRTGRYAHLRIQEEHERLMRSDHRIVGADHRRRHRAVERQFAVAPVEARMGAPAPDGGGAAALRIAGHGERALRREAAHREARLAVRRERSAPLVAELEDWMRTERAGLSRHAAVARAMDYMLKRWGSFARFLDDGRICLTNNAAERALRGIALGRRAWLFAGSDRGGVRAAVMYTLIGTAKLNDVDPQAWLADVLDRIADLPQTRLHELLPWSWKADRQQALAA